MWCAPISWVLKCSVLPGAEFCNAEGPPLGVSMTVLNTHRYIFRAQIQNLQKKSSKSYNGIFVYTAIINIIELGSSHLYLDIIKLTPPFLSHPCTVGPGLRHKRIKNTNSKIKHYTNALFGSNRGPVCWTQRSFFTRIGPCLKIQTFCLLTQSWDGQRL